MVVSKVGEGWFPGVRRVDESSTVAHPVVRPETGSV